MNIDLAALPDDVETLQRLVRALAIERTSLREANAEIERLNLIIKKLQRSQFGRRAERLDDDQLQLGLEDLNTDLARVEASLPPPQAEADTLKARDKRPSLPAHLTREDVRLDIEHQACPCWGGALHLIGETTSDHVPAAGRPYLPAGKAKFLLGRASRSTAPLWPTGSSDPAGGSSRCRKRARRARVCFRRSCLPTTS